MKKKTPEDIISLHLCITNDNHWCMVSEIWGATDKIISQFGLFFALLPPIKVENQNFEIVKKTPGDIILQMCTINYNHIMYGSWDI